MTPQSLSPPLQAYVELFEKLEPADLGRFDQIFTADARFKDPFNDVRGIAAIERIFEHMFDSLNSPRFIVHHAAENGVQAYIYWLFNFQLSKRDISIEGLTLVRFDASGKVTEHIDYWDPAEQLYSKLPVLGFLTRRLTRLFTVKQIKKNEHD